MSRTRLRWTLGLLFIALAVPSAVLVMQTQRQLKWEAFHQQRQLAVELAERIDEQLQRLISAEEARGYADYSFLTVADVDAARLNIAQANNAATLLQRSPLAEFPVRSEFPGLLGWFQIDADGSFASPLLPNDEEIARLGLTPVEVGERRALTDQLLDVLGRNELAVRRPTRQRDDAVRELKEADDRSADEGSYPSISGASKPAESPSELAAAPSPQVVFDQLKQDNYAPRKQAGKALGNVADLQLEDAYADRDELRKDKKRETETQRGRRVEQTALPIESSALDEVALEESARDEIALSREVSSPSAATPTLRIFDSELDPFEFAQLGSGHFVLFRRVWRNGERSIQGALIAHDEFLRGAMEQPFTSSLLATVSELLVAWQGDVLQRVEPSSGRRYGEADDELSGTLLHRTRLAAPLADFELIWTIRRLPTSPGVSLVFWAGAVLFAVLLAGFFALYRLGLRQLALAKQQQGFIAAVSHELKTPLTSIRMYGELLRAGWATEEKKLEYYDYIHDESERLSRLIANVLQLARLERDELQLDLKPHSVSTLFDLIRSRVQSQIERAGFDVEFRLDPACAERELQIDADALIQIMINLVDNALKFSARATQRRIEIKVEPTGKQQIAFAVRDFGPGIPTAMRRRVFDLFYRGGDELTRETQGTGIGLALVRQLAQGMNGEIELQPRQPGVEFRLVLAG